MSTFHKVPHDEAKFRLVHAIKIIREWRDDDTYPFMRKNAANYLAPRLAFFISVLAVALHWYWALSTGCGYNFARSGAVLVIASALAFGWISWHDPKLMLLDGGKVASWSFFNPLFILPLIAFIGTIIWGYGDLLPFGRAC